MAQSSPTAAEHGSHNQTHESESDKSRKPYAMLGLELICDFIVMFFVMYAMIATIDHLYLNIGNVYMTLMMVAPMALLMLLFMRHMYSDRRMNVLVAGLAVALFLTGWFGMREQFAVGDAQFARSMIPHHSGAILMCREAKLSDPELVALCKQIIAAQEREIAQMQSVLARIEH